MNHPQNIQVQVVKKVILLGLIIIILTGCAKTKNELSTPTSAINSPTIIPATSTQAVLASEIPTVTPTLLIQKSAQQSDSGLIVFSMSDGLYTHLFAYNPFTLPVTRLTANNWDDKYPAISPDGSKIAFASNRDKQWDIYILDLKADTLTRLTQTKTYDSSPAWSPDGQYIIFQTLNGENLDLIIQSVTDLASAPIQLTADSGNNYDPAWSPDGRQIAFVTNRTGRSQIWLADLQSADNRFTVIAASDEVDFSHPAWSPDGTALAWCALQPQSHIQSVSLIDPNSIKEIGIGCSPIWSPDGTSILASYTQPNTQYLVAYSATSSTLALPMIPFSSSINSIDWKAGNFTSSLSAYLNLQSLAAPDALFTPILTLPVTSTGRKGVVPITNVAVENAYLADTTDESFTALRQALGQKLGWDYLNALDNAYLPLTAAPSPGITQNWLFTGRAIAINTVPLDANWMVLTREEFNDETYWRVWLKCLDQTGGCGEPMHTAAWDFSARYSGDTVTYENGGQLSVIPSGYWFNFSEFANRFGWERLPAQIDWRYYLNGSLFNYFVFRRGLNWQQAILELYPPEALQAIGIEVK